MIALSVFWNRGSLGGMKCPNRDVWLKARDKLYDEIQTKGYNHEQQFFGQSPST
jgi:GH15 family glucan-1,4-alpha-glucosidase